MIAYELEDEHLVASYEWESMQCQQGGGQSRGGEWKLATMTVAGSGGRARLAASMESGTSICNDIRGWRNARQKYEAVLKVKFVPRN